MLYYYLNMYSLKFQYDDVYLCMAHYYCTSRRIPTAFKIGIVQRRNYAYNNQFKWSVTKMSLVILIIINDILI